MRCAIKTLFLPLLILPITSFANVDMVMGDADQNELIISWSQDNSVFLGKYSDGTYTDIIQHADRNAATVTKAVDSGSGEHVLLLPYVQGEFGVPTQTFTYSYENLTLESVCPVASMQMNDRFGLLKTPDERWDALLAYSNIAFTSSAAIIWAEQTCYEINSSGDLTGINSAWWDKYYYFPPDSRQQSQYPAVMVGPVVCPGGFPLIATSFGYDGSTQGWLMNHSLVFDPDSSGLLCHTIGEWWDPLESGVLGLGSSSDTEAVLLFADSLGSMNWSLYTTLQPGPEGTSPLPWGFPDQDDPVAFSSAGSLPGMLMVWYRDGQIRCRHWNGQWNNYDYFIASSMSPPMLEGIAVCADTDGYWIAWLPVDASEPQVVFVNFGVVTDLPEQSSCSLDPVVFLRPLENPVRGSLSVEVFGTENGQISVIDLSGRIILQAEADREGVHQLGELPVPGVYLIRMCHPGGATTARVVSIK
jgi:hypothetical protein